MTEPASVTAWRVMLLACPTVVAAGFATTNIYYPAAAPSPDNGVAGTVPPPYAVIAEEQFSRSRFMSAGTLGLPRGTLSAVFYFGSDIGSAESFARLVEGDLYAVTANAFPITSVTTELSSKPTPGQEAAGNNRAAADYAVALTAEYGLG